MVVGNHQCNAANLNQNKPQFQLELSLAQFSPSLLFNVLNESFLKIYPLPCIETKRLEYQVKNKITRSIVYKLIREAFTQI